MVTGMRTREVVARGVRVWAREVVVRAVPAPVKKIVLVIVVVFPKSPWLLQRGLKECTERVQGRLQ